MTNDANTIWLVVFTDGTQATATGFMTFYDRNEYVKIENPRGVSYFAMRNMRSWTAATA